MRVVKGIWRLHRRDTCFPPALPTVSPDIYDPGALGVSKVTRPQISSEVGQGISKRVCIRGGLGE